jgi:hypothetical protein
MTKLQQATWWRFGIWMVIGLVVYFAYSHAHSRLRRGEDPVGLDEGPRFTRDPSGSAPAPERPTPADRAH